jgi:ribonuclease P protein component
MCHETYLPTFPPGPQAPPWLARPHENQERTQINCQAPPQRSFAPFRVSVAKKKPNRLLRLRKRAEFVRVSGKGSRAPTPAFVLQHLKPEDEKPALRYGLTATKKLGNAVKRNRARRRLRSLAEKILPVIAANGDYVLVAREGVFTRPFPEMEKDLETALRKLSGLK